MLQIYDFSLCFFRNETKYCRHNTTVQKFLSVLSGATKNDFFLKSLEKNKRLRETTDKRRKGKKNNKFAKYKLKYIWWIISFFHIYSLGISKGGIIIGGMCTQGIYIRGHIVTCTFTLQIRAYFFLSIG